MHHQIDLKPEYLDLVRQIVAARVPHAEVRAFGSRVTGTNHETSDLDLVVFNPEAPGAPVAGIAALREAFRESNLPLRVDVLDWARVPEGFRRNMEAAYVVVWQPGQRTSPTTIP